MENKHYIKIDGTEIVDVKEYVREFIIEHPTVQVHIGCDSQERGENISYAVTLCLYIPGHGGHVISKRVVTKKASRYEKLWKEVELSISAAEELESVIKNQELTIHVDYNVKPTEGSHSLYDAGIGYITACGYKALGKPNAWASTKVADKVCRKRISVA